MEMQVAKAHAEQLKGYTTIVPLSARLDAAGNHYVDGYLTAYAGEVINLAVDLRAIADDLAGVQAATFLDDRTVNGAIDRLRAAADRLAGRK